MLHVVMLVDSTRPAESGLLATSIRRFHPEATTTWLVCDPRPVVAPEAALVDDVRYAAAVTIGRVRYADVVVGLSPAAARWAVIPAVVAPLLADDHTVVVLPAAAELHGPVDDLLARADGGTALLARRFDPASGSATGGWVPEVAVFGPRSSALLSWWAAEAERWSTAEEVGDDDRIDPWRTFLDGGADLHAVGDGRFRVAPATVDQIRFSGGAEGAPVLVDGRPLALATFPDLDPRRPWWYVAAGEDRPRASVGEVDQLHRLCHDRADRLVAAGWSPPATPSPLDAPLSAPAAAAYRELLRDHLDGAAEPANPFVAGGADRYLAWLAGSGSDGPTGLSRVADAVWAERSDLAAIFGPPRGAGRSPFLRWLWTAGLDEGVVATALLPELPARVAAAPATVAVREPGHGVNLVGNFGHAAGLGVAAQNLGRALDAAHIPWVAVDRAAGSGEAPRDLPVGPARYGTNLVLDTADQMGHVVGQLGPAVFEGRTTVGLWYWETDVVPRRQRAAFGLVDEIWASTEYLRATFAAASDTPVHLVPVPLEFPDAPNRAAARAGAGLDARCTFLFTFDFRSVARRKNPVGVVDAYRRAFPTDDDRTRLVVKSIHGDDFPEPKERLLDAMAGRHDIELRDVMLSPDERLSLVAAADCFVSLHRSEGLGLTMAEAMSCGTPVIASAYSGNLDFCDGGAALLVGGREVPVGAGTTYPADGRWWDPDLDEAATHLRAIRDDAALRDQLAEAGMRSLERFSSARVGDRIDRRLRELRCPGGPIVDC